MGLLSTQKSCELSSFHPWSDTYHEQWAWNNEDKSPSVYLCLNNKVACFYIDPVIESTGTAAVRGTKAFTHGQHYWEVKLSSVFGTSIMIGVGTKDALLQTNDFEFVDLIGRDNQSWGLSYKGKIWHNGQVKQYCEPFYDSTVIGVLLDMDAGTLSYFMSGKPLGIAFTGLCEKAKELYPIISSTSTLSEIELCDSTCRYVSLQDQCRMTIAKLVNKDKIDFLPLPRGMCQSLKGV
ncbi:SPRY domain-containing SOCS box protein 3-like [Montipora capricornis]|uniref:SPRY domain-containing SOCS box protein 3-like n=1 Tax=Montipora capricornis TaxID=246305 RepID=UPI0035F1D412